MANKVLMFIHHIRSAFHNSVYSGGSRGGGSGPPPLLGHDVGFLTLGPKLDPPPFCECPRVGCFSIFLRADDVTRTMSKGGGACEKSCIRAWTPPPFQKSWIRAWFTKDRPNIIELKAKALIGLMIWLAGLSFFVQY